MTIINPTLLPSIPEGWELVTDKNLSSFVYFDSVGDFVISEDLILVTGYVNSTSIQVGEIFVRKMRIGGISYTSAISSIHIATPYGGRLTVTFKSSSTTRSIFLYTYDGNYTCYRSNDGTVATNNQITDMDNIQSSSGTAQYAIFKRKG